MAKVTVEITAGDVDRPGGTGSGASAAERALRRAGLIGDVHPHRIRLYDRPTGTWREVDTPGQLRRFMRLLDSGCVVPPPKVTIELPEGWQQSRAQADLAH
jgi:hypothetical protein